MRPRLLVVNGDDFGLTPGVNRGIVDAHRQGVLTSASLLARAPATEEAIALAASEPALGVGCHLALVDADPVLAPESIPTLVGGDGRLRPTWQSFMRDLVLGRVSTNEIERELAAQIERVAAAGVRLTHLDSHKHVHAYPPIFAIVARLRARFAIPALRVPVERPAFSLFLSHLGRRATGRQAAENLLLAWWGRADRALALASGAAAPAFLGRIDTGHVTAAALDSIVGRLRDGTNELMLHPGYSDGALDRVRTRLREARAKETALACAPEVRELLGRRHVRLVNHRGDPHPRMEQTRYA